MREHRIYQTYNADMWHRWLSKRAAFWAKQHARSTPIYIAELMRALLAERYGVPFAQHYEGEAVAFSSPTVRSLGGSGRCCVMPWCGDAALKTPTISG